MTTVSANTPANYTLELKPYVIKFYPSRVTVGLAIEIDVTDG
jgi:hypothetical protein